MLGFFMEERFELSAPSKSKKSAEQKFQGRCPVLALSGHSVCRSRSPLMTHSGHARLLRGAEMACAYRPAASDLDPRYPIQLRNAPSTRTTTATIIVPDLLAKIISPTPYILFGNERLRAPRTIASQPRMVMITRQSETQRLCTFTMARPARSANMPRITVAD